MQPRPAPPTIKPPGDNMPREDFMRYYATNLGLLHLNSRPDINTLTIAADKYKMFYQDVVALIEDRIQRADENRCLPYIYVMDCITKNVGQPYITHFGQRAFAIFTNAYNRFPQLRDKLKHLLSTWKPFYGEAVTNAVQECVNQIDNRVFINYPAPDGSMMPQAVIYAPVPPGTAGAPVPMQIPPYPNVPLSLPLDPTQAGLAGYVAPVPYPTAIPPTTTTSGIPPSTADFMASFANPAAFGANNPQFNLLQAYLSTLVNPQHNPPSDLNNNASVDNSNAVLNTLTSLPQSAPHITNMTTPSNNNNNNNNFVSNNVSASANNNNHNHNHNHHHGHNSKPPTRNNYHNNNNNNSSSNNNNNNNHNRNSSHTHSDPAPIVTREFTSNSLKQRNNKIISILYSGESCSTCGFRFKDHTSMSAHLDWHFRMNSMEKAKGKTPLSRNWFLPISEWNEFKGLEVVQQAANSVFEQKDSGKKQAVSESTFVKAEDGQTKCPACNEEFQTVFNEGEDEWVYLDTIRDEVDGKIYHAECSSITSDSVDGENQTSITSENTITVGSKRPLGDLNGVEQPATKIAKLD